MANHQYEHADHECEDEVYIYSFDDRDRAALFASILISASLFHSITIAAGRKVVFEYQSLIHFECLSAPARNVKYIIRTKPVDEDTAQFITAAYDYAILERI